MVNRVINFYAGPAGLPVQALERAKAELLDFEGTGMSVMEISHRSKEYDAVHNEAIALVKELLNVPDNYKVLLLQGGGNLQFAMLPMNILHSGRKADYIVTGNWAKKAFKEAKTVAGDAARAIVSTEEEKFNRLPRPDEIHVNPDCGLRALLFQQYDLRHAVERLPADRRRSAGGRHVLRHDVAALRREALSASSTPGAQKNLGPSGLVVALIRDDFLEMCAENLPNMLQYKVQAAKNSLFNTPPCFSVYILRNVLAYNKSIGGLDAIYRNNLKKGELLYGVIDKYPEFYKGYVKVKDDRSFMNVDFNLPSEDLDARFVAEAKAAGMVGLKGYRTMGGIRVSMYNAVTVDQVETLCGFMEEFVKKNG